jgi:uncharacterized protein YndB with AHSA1/START domain
MTSFQTTRVIAATPEEVFAAIASPQRLARWWGPEGFRNSFDTCEFRPGGVWEFTMHGPQMAPAIRTQHDSLRLRRRMGSLSTTRACPSFG